MLDRNSSLSSLLVCQPSRRVSQQYGHTMTREYRPRQLVPHIMEKIQAGFRCRFAMV